METAFAISEGGRFGLFSAPPRARDGQTPRNRPWDDG